MSKRILTGPQKLAIINPRKKMGEDGQYVSYGLKEAARFTSIADKARQDGMELRWYWSPQTSSGQTVQLKRVVTEIPPGHIQPFHHHDNVDELSIVTSGEIRVIDSDDLNVEDRELLMEMGISLRSGQMVVEQPGVRHTVANFNADYAVFETFQTLRSKQEFSPDWK